MKKNKNLYDALFFLAGFIAMGSLYISAIIDYQSVVTQEFNRGTKVRGFQLIIQKLDAFGGSSAVYGFFTIISLFFIYKIAISYYRHKKTQN